MRKIIQKKFLSSSLAVLLVLLFLAIIQLVFPNSFSFLGSVSNILKKPFYSISKNIDKDNRSIEVIKVENQLLRETIRNMVIDYTEVESLKNENTELKSLLAISENRNENVVAAEIIGNEKIESNNYIIVNKGLKHGLGKDMPVIVKDNILIGIIAYAYDDYSFVVSPSQHDVAISAKVLGSSQDIQGVVEGRSGLAMHLELIPKEANIKKDDLVVTSGSDLNIPNNLVIGMIEEINDISSNFFKSASLKSLALPNEYQYVGVLTSNPINSTSTLEKF